MTQNHSNPEAIGARRAIPRVVARSSNFRERYDELDRLVFPLQEKISDGGSPDLDSLGPVKNLMICKIVDPEFSLIEQRT